MSDYNRLDAAALDRYITGNYGEDQFRNEPSDEDEECTCGHSPSRHEQPVDGALNICPCTVEGCMCVDYTSPEQ